MSQRLGSIWKGRAWDDGNVIPRVTLPDGTLAEAMASMGYGWNATASAFQKLTVDNATGGLTVYVAGQAGGGSAVSIADGADVAQGTTTDLSSASTVVGILKAIKAAVTGTLTTTTSWASAQHVIVDTAPTTAVTGTFFQVTQPVSLATNTPDVTDRAARLLGVVDKGKVWDGTNTVTVKAGVIAVAGDNPLVVTVHPSSAPTAAQPVTGTFFQGTQPVSAASLPLPTGASTSANQSAVKAASTLAAATDTSQVVQQSPMRADASTLAVTATAAVNTALTLTVPAAAAGLFHYITSIQIVKLYSVVGVAAGAGNLITTTNLPGSPVWTTEQLASAAGTAVTVVDLKLTTPLKSSVAATNTTIVCPQQLQTIWRVNVTYYTAP